jgi:hypothetical protein
VRAGLNSGGGFGGTAVWCVVCGVCVCVCVVALAMCVRDTLCRLLRTRAGAGDA